MKCLLLYRRLDSLQASGLEINGLLKSVHKKEEKRCDNMWEIV